MAKNYYIVLGLNRNASDADIRSAYRRLAKEYHPDHYGRDSEPFLLIHEAYSVLSDPARKSSYDRSLNMVHSRPEAFRDITAERLSGRYAEPMQATPNDAYDVFHARYFSAYLPSLDEIINRLLSNFSSRDRTEPGARYFF